MNNTPPVLKLSELNSSQRSELTKRGVVSRDLQGRVQGIMEKVRMDGDTFLREIAQKWDGLDETKPLRVSTEEMQQAWNEIPEELKQAMKVAKQNIETFHKKQKPEPVEAQVFTGMTCQQKAFPIERVGLYVPGGTAPLFSTVLMLTIPAQLAGCQEIVMMSPGRSLVTLAAAHLCGVEEFYACGGAQAIAAMTYGTESISPVFKIFGPGNSYVTEAKIQASALVAVDMPAGPSEVFVVADESASSQFLAWDMLSQLEHDPEAQAVLVSTSEEQLVKTQNAIYNIMPQLQRKEIIQQSLVNSRWVLAESIQEAMEFSNDYAPEHLILQMKNPREWASQVRNAGSVFIGPFTPESFGDYASGTNHVLPTAGAAKAYSGISLKSFLKLITFQEATKDAMQVLAPTVVTLAKAEGLECHAQAAQIRMENSWE